MFKLIVFGYLFGTGTTPMEKSRFYHEYKVSTLEQCEHLEKWQHDTFSSIFQLNTNCIKID